MGSMQSLFFLLTSLAEKCITTFVVDKKIKSLHAYLFYELRE